MKWNSIVVKLGASILGIVLIILLPLGFVTQQIFLGFYYNKVQDQLIDLSAQYAQSITSIKDNEILRMFETLAKMTDQEIIIVNSQGKVIANSGIPSIMEINKNTIHDVSSLKKALFIKDEFNDKELKNRYLYIGRPLYNHSQFIGGIYVFSSIGQIIKSIDIIKKLLILAGIGSLMLALGLIFMVSRRLANPLIEMTDVTKRIAKGDLKSRVVLSTKDEIGLLAESINDLAIELDHYRSNRQEFFASISHELRTPITYLEGYAHALEHHLYQSEEEKESYLIIIRQEANRMSQLVNDLFELSKMEEGKFPIHLEKVDLIEVLDNAVNKTRLKAKEKELQLIFDYHLSLPFVIADGARLEQVIINLIENAIRYTKKGFIKINVLHKASHLVIVIQDTGIGVPEEDIPYLFDRFYRVEKSRSRNYGGTGLGLAIVKQLIILQNGTINVHSQVGEGSQFEITLPIYEVDIQ